MAVRACRRPAPGRGPTTCGSCSARRRGTWPPGPASASPARWPAPASRRSGRGTPPGESSQSFRFLTRAMFPAVHGAPTVTVTVSDGTGRGRSVRTTVCRPPGFGLSCSASPSATPSPKTTRPSASPSRSRTARRRLARRRRSWRLGRSGRVLKACSRRRRGRSGGTRRPRRAPGSAASSGTARARRRPRGPSGRRPRRRCASSCEREGLADPLSQLLGHRLDLRVQRVGAAPRLLLEPPVGLLPLLPHELDRRRHGRDLTHRAARCNSAPARAGRPPRGCARRARSPVARARTRRARAGT